MQKEATVHNVIFGAIPAPAACGRGSGVATTSYYPLLPLPFFPMSSSMDDDADSYSHRLEQRTKQITIGKATNAYANYLRLVSKDQRRYDRRLTLEPKTPDVHKICSTRAWAGLVRQWRRLLHQWDTHQPEPSVHSTATPTSEDQKEDEEAEFIRDQAIALANILALNYTGQALETPAPTSATRFG